MRFILDNLFLTQETLAWTDESNQDLLFLKLDFFKVYDMVEWSCLFKVMERMGFPTEFVHMVNLIFQDAAAAVKVNGIPSPQFRIKQGVRQGCPLVPYLFLIVSEVLNAMVMKEATLGKVQGIKLLFPGHQQILAQYTEDTSFTLVGEETKVRNLIQTLNTFCLATGLVLNWSKSNGYWKSNRLIDRPSWTDGLGVT